MKYQKIEYAILTAQRERNLTKLGDIQTILDHKTRILNMSLAKLMTGTSFEKRPQFKKVSEEYSTVARLHRMVGAYAWS